MYRMPNVGGGQCKIYEVIFQGQVQTKDENGFIRIR